MKRWLFLSLGAFLGCSKIEDYPPPYRKTVVRGRAFYEQDGAPVAGAALEFTATRPKRYGYVCLFCPSTYAQQVDSVTTDPFGKYDVELLVPRDASELSLDYTSGTWKRARIIERIGGVNDSVNLSFE